MSRTTLYLHIGTPKTGTSAIQDFLAENAEQLEKEQYIFPDFGIRYYKIRAGRNGRWLRCMENEEEIAVWNKNMDTLASMAGKYKGIIMTDESLWTWCHGDPEGALAFWSKIHDKVDEIGLDLKIIVYLRRQDQFLYSFWAQKVKSAEKSSFHDYMWNVGHSRLQLDYYSHLENIAHAVGSENITALTYDRSRWTNGQTIQSEFLKVCGIIVNESYVYPDRQSNPSLSDVVLEAKRLLNRRPEFCDRMNYSNRYLKIAQNRLQKEGRLKNRTEFPNEERRIFLEEYARINQAVAEKYLHTEGPLFDESDLSAPSEKADYSSEELADVYGVMIDAMHKELRKKQALIKKQKKELAAKKSLPEKVVRKIQSKIKKKG